MNAGIAPHRFRLLVPLIARRPPVSDQLLPSYRVLRRLRQAASTIGLLLTICFLCQSSIAQSPRVERIENAGGQRGRTFDIVLHGERLNSVNDILFYGPGLSVSRIRHNDSLTTTISINASKDCLLGEHPFRVLSPTGISDLRTLHISPYPRTSEIEPNNDISSAMPLEQQVSVHGLVEEGDVDLFKFRLDAGERLSAEVVGIRNTQYLFDAQLSILDATGTVLAANDDSVLHRQDPVLSFLAPKKGDYFLAIREAAYGGDHDCLYQLHIGRHPRPVVCYPAGGQAGTTQTLTLIGDARGPVTQSCEMPATGNVLALFPEDDSGIAPTPIPLRVSPYPNVLESEPNDERSNASLVAQTLPVAINGILQTQADVDTFRIQVKAGILYRVSLFGKRVGSPIDSVVRILTQDGVEIISNDDGVNHDSEFRFSALTDGEYLVQVRDHLGRGGQDYVYRIEFQPVAPSLRLSVPVLSEIRQQQLQKIEIPRGGRAAIVVSARRQNFRSQLELLPDFLPDGVSVKSSGISGDSHLGYLLFEAVESAPISSGLFGINGVGTANGESVHGRLQQTTGLAFGPPRRTIYHSIGVSQLPFSVLDRGPFTLDVVPPVAPLSIDGQLELSVVVQRNGYDGEIKLALPILPPWIEVPEDGVAIPAGSDSTIFTLTATDGAEPRQWTILMTGEADIDGEAVFASSDEFSFEVVPPYLDVEIAKAVSRQGGHVRLACEAQWSRTAGTEPATARLRGLPKHVEVPAIRVPVGSKKFSFELNVGKDAPASIHNTLFVEMEVPERDSFVRHFLGRGGVLEVLAEGQKPRDPRSQLERLRAKAKTDPATSDVTTID